MISMLISEKSRMVTYLFLSCYANEIPLSSLYKKIREILGTDYFSHMLDQATLRKLTGQWLTVNLRGKVKLPVRSLNHKLLNRSQMYSLYWVLCRTVNNHWMNNNTPQHINIWVQWALSGQGSIGSNRINYPTTYSPSIDTWLNQFLYVYWFKLSQLSKHNTKICAKNIYNTAQDICRMMDMKRMP